MWVVMARKGLVHWLGAILSLVALTPSPLAAQQARVDEQAFSEEVLARLRAVYRDGELRIKPDEPLVIQVRKAAGWDEAVFNLNRIYGYCQQNPPADCEQAKAEFVDRVVRPLPEVLSKNLRVIVRDQAYLDYITQVTRDRQDAKPLTRDLGGGLYALLAVDAPQNIALANPAALEKLGLGESAAWDVALAQTRAALPAIPADKIAKREGFALEGKEYLASLLAFDDEWSKLAAAGGADMFVTAVSDQFVFVGFLADGPKMDEFRQAVVDDCNAQPRCVTPQVFRLRNGRWVADR